MSLLTKQGVILKKFKNEIRNKQKLDLYIFKEKRKYNLSNKLLDSEKNILDKIWS